MVIREKMEQDLSGLLQLYTHLNDNPLPEESAVLWDIWGSILQDKNHHIIVAEEEGVLVSSCVLLIVPNLTRGQRPHAVIENVVTHQLYRNLGAATACLNHARQIAQEHNCFKIMLMTGSKLDSTLNFYRNAGYNSEDKTGFVQWL